MIKAIIFDFFGVLAIKDVGSFRKTLFPNDKYRMDQAAKLQEQLGLGQIGYDDYIDGLAKLGNVKKQEVLKYTENYQPNSELLNYIKTSLQGAYKLAIISNAGADWVEKILGPDVRLFDNIVLSYKAGVIKPEPAIYELSAKNLGLQASECLFIDDILTYCKGAEAIGMKTIWYQDFEQTKTELDKLLSADTNK